VPALKVEHRATRPRPEDSVHRQVSQWEDLVQAPLRRGDEPPLLANLEHHPLAGDLHQAVSPGTRGSGDVGTGG